jgi:fructokinase
MAISGTGIFGAIEAGGSKFVCGIGTGPEDIVTTRICTTSPEATVNEAISWLREHSQNRLKAVGIGSFGPVDLNPSSRSYGYITSTPKAAWRNFDLRGAIGKAFGVPVHFDTDVNAAILGEARWGAARDISDCLYLTIGTGIGGGAIVSGHLLHGVTHPEMGHIRIPHNLATDPFSGACPYHGDCLEGLASGPAIEARWGAPASSLPPDHPAWALEAHYLAAGIANFACTLSPARILLGGGVMRQAQLYELIRIEVACLLANYLSKPPLILPPQLGHLAGVLGALALADQVP